MKKQHLHIVFCLLSFPIWGQKAKSISFTNPSFEDIPKQGLPPVGWLDCGAVEETPPDVQPNGVFGVVQTAQNGGTFLGLVVRDNSTTESVGQRMKTPLLKNVPYQFSLWACRSEFYNSVSRVTNKSVNYNTPAILELWGANEDGSINQKLAESPALSQTSWSKIDFEFTPKNDYVFFIIKAYFTNGATPYNGNILVDNISEIKPQKPKKEVEMPTLLVQNKAQPNSKTPQQTPQSYQTVAVKKSTETTATVVASPTIIAQNSAFPISPKPVVDAPVKPQTAAPQPTKTNCPIPSQVKITDIGLTMATLNCAAVEGTQFYQFEFQQYGKFEWQPLKAQKNTQSLQNLKPASKYFVRVKTFCESGQSGNYSETMTFNTDKIFTIPDLLFASNSAVLPEIVFPKLNDIVKILNTNPSLEIEVGGHTNTKTSGDYAKELSEKRAISVKQYFVKQGISTERMRTKGYGDTKPLGKDETKNQRVEIRFF
jgi:outer membrane protein OmpA-like peptidoglycan-associated protein